MAEEGEAVHERGGGQPNVAQTPANADGRVVVGAGAPEQDADGSSLFDEELAELDQDINEFADLEDKSLYWDAVSRREMVRFLKFASETDSDVFLLSNSTSSITDKFSAALESDQPVAVNAAQYADLKGAIDQLKNTIENNIADKLLDLPLGIGSLGKYVLRRLVGQGAKRAARARLRRMAQERILRRRRRRRERRDCRLAGNPAFMPTGIPVHYDPDFFVPGLLRLAVTSTYYGNVETSGPLGRGRLSDIDATIIRNDKGGFTFLDEDGFGIDFAAPTPIPEGWEEGDTTRNTQLMQGHRRALIFREDALTTCFEKGPDAIWRISKIEDRSGNTLFFDRDAEGSLLTVTTPEGLKLRFTYSAGLRQTVELEGVDGSRKTVMRYGYDSDGRMVFADCPYGERHEFAYDDEDRLSQVVRNGRYHAKFEHDSTGRRQRTQSNQGAPALFEYDEENRITTYLPGSDRRRAVQFHYNDNKNIVREVNALGHEKVFVEDEEGLIVAEINGEGSETRYDYDAAGHIKRVTDASGRSTYYSWTPEGDLEMVIDNAGKAWHFQYDDFGRLVLVKSPLGHITEIHNNEAGQPVGIIRHDGLIEQNRYDSHHWLIETLDFRSARTRLERDGFGRILRVTETDGTVTQYQYEDQPGQNFFVPSATTRADGVVTRSRTSRQGRVVETIDGEGRQSVYEYDGLGNLIAAADPKGGRIEFHYNDEFELERVVNAIGKQWVFVRDGAGRIVEETDFDGRTTRYVLDKADHVAEAHQPDGRIIAYQRDPAGRILSRSAFLPGQPEPFQRETFDYDDVGRLRLAANAQVTLQLEYDDLGRLTAETTNGIRIENTYDCCGNRTERRIGDQITTYEYDALGALTGLSVAGSRRLSIVRNRIGRPTRHVGTGGFLLEFEHDEVGQLVRHTAFSDARPGPASALPDIWSRRFGWDRAAGPTVVGDPLWGASRYETDENGQVVLASHGQPDGGMPLLSKLPEDVISGFGGENHEVERFEYAPTLDIVASETALPHHPLGRPLSSWSLSDGGRVLQAQGAHGERIYYEYDAAGRAIARHVERNGFRRQTFQFTWDGFDQLIEVKCPDGSIWTYGYDPLGRRIEKRQIRTRDRAPEGASVLAGCRFLWDGNVLAASYPLSEDKPAQSAVWWHFEPDSFVPILRIDTNRSGEERVLHVITDHLGAPRELADATGEIVWSSSYRLWGGLRGLWTRTANDNRQPGSGRPSSSAAGAPIIRAVFGNTALSEEEEVGATTHSALEEADLCPIRFLGQWEDAETGLYYNRFRTYDPQCGQYLSPDPLGLSGGLRSHGYVEIPTWWADPLGLYGVYVFQVKRRSQCYVGKGEPGRMEASMKYRSGASTKADGRKNCPRKLYTNTDADAAAAGMDPKKYGALVENRLLADSGFDAVQDPMWLNEKFDGQAAFRDATAAQQAAATATAARIKRAFGSC
ncbi:RHS repeat-associated core domain-containing protein [Neorhizobium alkalisoli]|uniref:RHS repeat-associated core domain-containing protein n=1 Tax=Neorhizobium alkalisoli TaxID=528178 RepID=UPI000CF97F73|nr:RHS repeat-associated core domain-containing protein [Neorhizobium alkalisoli]